MTLVVAACVRRQTSKYEPLDTGHTGSVNYSKQTRGSGARRCNSRGLAERRPMRWMLPFVLAFSAGCDSRTSSALPTSPSPSDFTASTLTFSGTVVASDTGEPVEGARVCWSPSGGLNCARTDHDGRYAFATDWPTFPSRGGTVSQITLSPDVFKEGFEYRQSRVPWDGRDRITWSPSLQPIVQIEAGQSVTATAFPNEGSGLVLEDECEGCKRIRIAVHRSGTLTYALRSETGSLRFWLPAYDHHIVGGPLAAQAGETVTVWITGAVAPTRFELSTSLTPES
jgi:hypothetical protein